MDDIIAGLRQLDGDLTQRAADELERFSFLTKSDIRVTRYRVGDIDVTQQPTGLWAVSRNNMSIAQDGSVWQTIEKVNTFPLHTALRLAEREKTKNAETKLERR